MKKPGTEISVIAPMYNEEKVIANSINAFIDYLDSLNRSYELIIVNDGSTDNSLKIAKNLESEYPNLKVVTYDRNRGRGYALREGIKNSEGKYVVTTESDLNWGAEIIGRMTDTLIKTGADIVIASPHMKGGKLENVPKHRAWLSSFGNRILRLAVKSKIHMVTGMTRAYAGDKIRKLHLEENGKEIHLEIIAKGELMDYSITEIPAILKWPDKKKGKGSKTRRKSSFKVWNLIKSHLLFATNEAPILLFGGIGGLLIIIGLMILFNLSWVFFIKNEIIGDRIITILSMVFLILSGGIILLVSFLSYQIRDVKKEIIKLKQMIHEQS